MAGNADESAESYLALAKRRWRPLLLIAGVVGFLTALIVFLQPRKYVATATFVAAEDPEGGGMGKAGQSIAGMASMLGMSGVAGLPGLGGGATKSPDFYAALLESKDLLDSVAVTTYHSSRGFDGDLVKFLKIKQPTRVESELATVKRLKKRLMEVTVDARTEIVGFAVTTTDPELSAAVARRCLIMVNVFNQSQRSSGAASERAFTERRSAEALGDLQKAERTLSDFDERNRAINQSPGLQTERQGLQRRIDIAEQTYMQLVLQFESARVEEVRNTPLITVIDTPERLVEPQPRNTILKAIVAALVAGIVAFMWMLNAERRRARPRRPAADEGYEESVEERERDLAAAD